VLKFVVNGSEPLKVANFVLWAPVYPAVDTRELRIAFDLEDLS
jgi:hypothetical protein